MSLKKILQEIRKPMYDNTGYIDIRKPKIYFEEGRKFDGSPTVMPLVALTTNPCQWLKKTGGCVLCGYQIASALNQTPTNKDLIEQTKYAIKKLPSNKYPFITFNSAGSFLDSKEINDEVRPILLELLYKNEYQELNIESRPEFLLEKNKLKQLKKYFSKVSASIGLDSSNDYIRNKILHKGTKLSTYIKAVKIAEKFDIECEAYVQLGKPFLTAKEDINDSIRSINYAFENGFSNIILMIANIQPYTLTQKLFEQGLYHPPELWRAIDVIKKLPSHKRKSVYIKGFDRACPTPLELAHNCFKCTPAVKQAFVDFNLTGDYDNFLKDLDCECRIDLKNDPNESLKLEERVNIFKNKLEHENKISI